MQCPEEQGITVDKKKQGLQEFVSKRDLGMSV